MSENVDLQVEEVPPEIYRRRRIAALLIFIFILLLIIGLISLLAGGGKNTEGTSAVASASASSEAFSDFSERPNESASASESAQASDSPSAEATSKPAESSAEAAESPEATPSTEAAESPEAAPSAEPNEAPVVAVACTAADLKVSISSDHATYAAGQNPALTITYTNTSETPCIITGGANNVDVNIISGPAQVYNYAQCHAKPAEDTEIAAGSTTTTPLTWNRSLNVLGCDSKATIQPGHYWATASVNGVESEPIRIVVTG